MNRPTGRGAGQMADRDKWISAGAVVKPHGIRGEVIVDVTRDLADMIASGMVVRLTGRKGCETRPSVEGVRFHAGRLIIKFRDVESRSEAESLRSQELWLTREQIGPLPQGRYYVQDIVGLTVYSEPGELLGRVTDVLFMPANDVYVVSGEGEEILLPVIDDVIRDVDLAGGRIVVHLMKGLRREDR
ncbi:MAG: 16S rRNA processing protein RimM [Candidatus Eisenbacteria bacterium]|nr:16S rRNA processing protein RimM [Candidatus Eisenbacteria bacterium]